MSSKRLFIAIAIPPEIRSTLATYKNHIDLAGLSWVKEENLHITLLFMGNIEGKTYTCH
jgi:2'-5' RNA ligase